MTSCDQGHGKLVSCISADFGEGTSCATDVQQNSSGLAQVAEISCFLVIFLFWEDPTGQVSHVPLWLLKLFPDADRRWTTVHFWLGPHDETLEDQGTGRAAFLCKSYWRAVFFGRNLETFGDICGTSMRHLWDIYETSMRHLWDIRHLKTFEANKNPRKLLFSDKRFRRHRAHRAHRAHQSDAADAEGPAMGGI